jgi:tetratricopeptide (TPR) repeat protein
VDDHDVRRARRECEEAALLAPREPLYQALVGLTSLELGDADRATRALDAAIELGHPHEERRAAFHLHRGRAHDLAGRRRDAETDYRRCLVLRADPPVHAAARPSARWATS